MKILENACLLGITLSAAFLSFHYLRCCNLDNLVLVGKCIKFRERISKGEKSIMLYALFNIYRNECIKINLI